MFYSNTFGRIFWVDEAGDFKSCPQKIDETGDFDMEDLISYVSEDLTNFCDKLTDSELKEEISLTLDDEIYDELVDNVTQQYPKQLNTFEKETFIDINNTGGKF